MKNKMILKQFLTLPLLLGFIFLSCQDEVVGGMENKVKNVEFNATIEKAKAIFEQKSPDFPVIQSRSGDGVDKGVVFEPTWEDAFIKSHKNGTITVETHIRLSQPFHMLPEESRKAYENTNDNRYLQHLSRAVVLMGEDENSEPLAFLMTIVGSKEYMEDHDFQLWDVSYGNIPEDFSGLIFYHTLSGSFVNGWHVVEGYKFGACEPISEEDANLLSRAVSCQTISVYRYYYECRENGGAFYETYEVNQGNSSHVCVGPYLRTESYQVCTYVEGSSSSDNVGTIIPYVDLSPLFVSYDSELFPSLQGFMYFMDNNDDASRAVLSYIDYVKSVSPNLFQRLNVQIDEMQTANSRYSAYNNTVYFKSVDHYSDIALYEEIIHALQRVVYTSVEIEEAPFNLEFEAKLIIDYMDFINNYEGNTDMALNMKYAQANLSDGSLKTLSQWVRANAYSYFDVDDYDKFMGIWKNFAHEYQNYMMSLRSYPKLIFPIIDEINNN